MSVPRAEPLIRGVKLKLLLLLTVQFFHHAAFASNAYVECIQRLSQAGFPEVSIHIQGENHRQPQLALELFRDASPSVGKHLLVSEGVAAGADEDLLQMRGDVSFPVSFRKRGPVFGVEEPIALQLQLFQVEYFNTIGLAANGTRPEYFRTPEGHGRWIRMLSSTRLCPELWQKVQTRPQAQQLAIFKTIRALVGTNNFQAIVDRVGKQSAYPTSVSEYVIATKIFMAAALSLLDEKYPFLDPWLENTYRLVFENRVELTIPSMNDLTMIRDMFVGHNSAAIVSAHFLERKPFQFLFGASHVHDLNRILVEEFGEVPKLKITFDENISATAQSGSDELYQRIQADLADREPPRYPR